MVGAALAHPLDVQWAERAPVTRVGEQAPPADVTQVELDRVAKGDAEVLYPTAARGREAVCMVGVLLLPGQGAVSYDAHGCPEVHAQAALDATRAQSFKRVKVPTYAVGPVTVEPTTKSKGHAGVIAVREAIAWTELEQSCTVQVMLWGDGQHFDMRNEDCGQAFLVAGSQAVLAGAEVGQWTPLVVRARPFPEAAPIDVLPLTHPAPVAREGVQGQCQVDVVLEQGQPQAVRATGCEYLAAGASELAVWEWTWPETATGRVQLRVNVRNDVPLASPVLVHPDSIDWQVRPLPVYDHVAKAAKLEGDCAVRVWFDEQGDVQDARAAGCPARLGMLAEQASIDTRSLLPVVVAGEPVYAVTDVVVSYRMDAIDVEDLGPQVNYLPQLVQAVWSDADKAPAEVRKSALYAAPKVARRPPPAHLDRAKELGISGVCEVHLWVNDTGAPYHAEVRDCPAELVDVSLEYAIGHTFEPATSLEGPIPWEYRLRLDLDPQGNRPDPLKMRKREDYWSDGERCGVETKRDLQGRPVEVIGGGCSRSTQVAVWRAQVSGTHAPLDGVLAPWPTPWPEGPVITDARVVQTRPVRAPEGMVDSCTAEVALNRQGRVVGVRAWGCDLRAAAAVENSLWYWTIRAKGQVGTVRLQVPVGAPLELGTPPELAELVVAEPVTHPLLIEACTARVLVDAEGQIVDARAESCALPGDVEDLLLTLRVEPPGAPSEGTVVVNPASPGAAPE
jgi:hypothetical protein